jgi:hypothetical protein
MLPFIYFILFYPSTSSRVIIIGDFEDGDSRKMNEKHGDVASTGSDFPQQHSTAPAAAGVSP